MMNLYNNQMITNKNLMTYMMIQQKKNKNKNQMNSLKNLIYLKNFYKGMLNINYL